jgi:hypothetical protein
VPPGLISNANKEDNLVKKSRFLASASGLLVCLAVSGHADAADIAALPT